MEMAHHIASQLSGQELRITVTTASCYNGPKMKTQQKWNMHIIFILFYVLIPKITKI